MKPFRFTYYFSFQNKVPTQPANKLQQQFNFEKHLTVANKFATLMTFSDAKAIMYVNYSQYIIERSAQIPN